MPMSYGSERIPAACKSGGTGDERIVKRERQRELGVYGGSLLAWAAMVRGGVRQR